MTNFRLQLKILIKQKKISVAKLSRMVDLNPATIYNYLKGKSEISATNLAKLFDYLNSNQRKEDVIK